MVLNIIYIGCSTTEDNSPVRKALFVNKGSLLLINWRVGTDEVRKK